MRLFFRLIIFSFFLFINEQELYATHNRAGEITFIQTGQLTIHATITLYTKTSSIAADRDRVEIFWGDGTSEFLTRTNGWGFPQPNDVKISYYEGNHTYPARGTYTMSMLDPNRIAGILNVNFPDSENVPFYLETTFSFLNIQFQGENNSVVLLQPPIDIGCVGNVFRHNPNAYDIDGDSISYELIVPLQSKDTPVPSYKMPDFIGQGPENNFYFNEKTGDLIWDSPQVPGDYNVAFRVNEYRNGKLITSTIRDMQIFITANCNSFPPQLSIPEDKCIIAGDTLTIRITAQDIDQGQKILINASGKPFISKYGKAFLQNNNIYGNSPLSSQFTWQTTCEHVAKPYYQILFKTMDNSISNTSGLVDLKTFKVRVSGPPPLIRGVNYENSKIKLTWEFPYPCINADNNYFRGFSIWRKENSNNFPIDSCVQGLDGKGYKIIEYLTDLNDANVYYYYDDDIEEGKIYCYRILGEYARYTDNGFPYNPVQSIASEEICQLIPDDKPHITKVSVLKTGINEGEIEINWTKPNSKVFDTLLYSPPYRYKLFRSSFPDTLNYIQIPEAEHIVYNYFQIDTFKFIDKKLNTMENRYFYKAYLYSNESKISESKEASSVFITAKPLDNKIRIVSSVNVPWNNDMFKFYKSDSFNGLFYEIASKQFPYYTDKNANNGTRYCYKVKSYGNYGFNTNTLINYSQIACDTPKDNEKPCSPELSVSNNCDYSGPDDDIINHLSWTNPNITCENTNDVQSYEIFFSGSSDSLFTLLYKIDNPDITDTIHYANELSGCYFIVSIDQSGNASEKSEIICAENCPLYQLPNTFTPNHDGQNDFFTPVIKRHITKIDLKVYNQWGIKVYETNNPDINWEGKSKYGKKLNPGTYYYVCKPTSYNKDLPLLKGFIEIVY